MHIDESDAVEGVIFVVMVIATLKVVVAFLEVDVGVLEVEVVSMEVIELLSHVDGFII